MPKPSLHQVIIGAAPGDAITDQALILRRWLREMGFESELYAESIHPALASEVWPTSAYRPGPGEARLILHHSIGSDIVEHLLKQPVRLILIYHNVTPASFFDAVHPALARQMQQGREQLAALRPHTDLALADSPYNEAELRAVGYTQTGVLPITLDESHYAFPPNPKLLAQFANDGPLILFVGRLAPNKKQDDLIKLLYFYRRIEPAARLLLVGDPWVPAYARWLTELATDLNLRDTVRMIGHVPQPDLVTYYRLASVYVSMSEHEGFGKPLIESMYLGVPVLAYAAAAVASTLGGAGVLFRHKHYEALAELLDILIGDEAWRSRLIARQRERAQAFLEPAVRRDWQRWLEAL